MRLPEAAQAFTNLGFPAPWFRIELSWAKVAGVIVLLVPMIPARLKEWAPPGFAINLASALIADPPLGQGPRFWDAVRHHQRALGALVHFLAPSAVPARDRCTVGRCGTVIADDGDFTVTYFPRRSKRSCL